MTSPGASPSPSADDAAEPRSAAGSRAPGPGGVAEPPASEVAATRGVRPGLGSRLRHVLDVMERDLAEVYVDMGLRGFRLRYTAVLRAVDLLGPSTIRTIADAIGVTHSAASQTVGQMRRDGFVEVGLDEDDGRARLVRLTERGEELAPALAAEWDATERAIDELEAELSRPLRPLLEELAHALERRSFRDRIGEVEW